MDGINTKSSRAPYGSRRFIVLAISLLLTAGCLANYGHLERSREINALFKSYQVLADHHYYYTGGQSSPRVIMGIHKRYILKTSSWTPMGPLTSEMLKKRIEGMTNEIGQAAENYGWVIFDPAGKEAGIWYSRLDQTSFKFGENGEIFVSQPRWDETDARAQFNTK